MDTTKWKEIERIFFELVELTPEEQAGRLESLRVERSDIYQEVYELIQEEQKLHPMLKTEFPQTWQAWKDKDYLGTMVGSYKLTKLLGSGGMGAVFLGERIDGQFDQTVALKLINEGIYGEQSLDYFKRERQILAKLQHPNIANLLDGGVTENGRPFYAMEFVKGLPINVYCENHRCTLKERLKLFIQVCEAVQYAHSQLVLHLDLKPTNILIDDEGRVKLMDFGISQIIQTVDDAQIGKDPLIKRYTLAYASPEQIMGNKLSTASDIYSLGVLLYELVTNQHPFEASTVDQMTFRTDILQKIPIYPSEALHGHAQEFKVSPNMLKDDLDLICLKALKKHPSDRYAVVNDIKEDIIAFLHQEPISLLRSSWSYVARKFLIRNSIVASLVVGAILLLVGMGTYYTWQLNSEKERALNEANKANQMVKLLSGMFTQANPNVSLGEDITAKEMLQLGANRFQQDLKDNPELLYEMYGILGTVYLDLGNYAKADSFFKLSLGLSQRISAEVTPDLLMSYYNLGAVKSREGKFDSATYFFNQVLEMKDDVHTEEVVSLSDIYYEMSVVEGENGNYQLSDSLLKLTLANRQNVRPDSFDALIFLSRGINARKLQEYDSAEHYYLRSLEIREELYPDIHPEIAHSLNHLSSLYQDMENYELALPYAEKSLAIRKTIFGEEHPETLASRSNVARTHSRSGNFEQAIVMYDTVLNSIKRVFGEDHHYISGITGSIGRLYLSMGKLQLGETYFRESLEIALRTLPKDHFNQSFSFLGVGQALIRQDKAKEAEEYIREALRIRSLTLPEDHMQFIEAQSALGECLWKLGQYEEGRKYLSRSMNVLLKDPEENEEEINRLNVLLTP